MRGRRQEATNVVSFERGRRRSDPARLAEFTQTALRLSREREEAAQPVARLLRELPSAEWPRMAQRKELRNSGALDRLSAEISSRMESEPQEALALSTLATAIAETLADDAYPAVMLAQLRAQAWKDRAGVLRYLHRNSEALEAVERAEGILQRFPGAAHDRAVVAFVKATILQQVDRFDESLAILNRCSAVFSEHGDTRLYLFCGIARGGLLYRQRRFADARDVLTRLLQTSGESADRVSYARIHANLAISLVELGELTEANIHLSEAVARFHDAGRTLEAARTELGAARVLLARGNSARGIERLGAARAAFTAGAMVEEAGLCGLEMAEALLGRGDISAAQQIAAEVAEEFAGAELNRRAVDAVTHLTTRLTRAQASADTIRHVRHYVESLRT
ncbi:MAG: hypothetical protein JWN02_2047, partial [Acidobacteria bacterium]|nr:hypothetical protein [Acidobacteriota bacterium]